ncbi:hypothetical protein GJ496_002716 [Pomphorhynchus laevis]|nr:hypothetical protein GJ496_002716 [Pomphorhynchus laevis]
MAFTFKNHSDEPDENEIFQNEEWFEKLNSDDELNNDNSYTSCNDDSEQLSQLTSSPALSRYSSDEESISILRGHQTPLDFNNRRKSSTNMSSSEKMARERIRSVILIKNQKRQHRKTERFRELYSRERERFRKRICNCCRSSSTSN